MTVTALVAGEVFTARLYKRLAQNPALMWANSYELRYNGAGGVSNAPDVLKSVLFALANFEQEFHLPSVLFDRGVISTYVEDGQPYDPETFITQGLTAFVGGRGTDGSGVEPLTTCLLVRRAVEYGRTGRALYRGALQDSEVSAGAGAIALGGTALSTLLGLVNTAFSTLNDELGQLDFELVMRAGPDSQGNFQTRRIAGMSVLGATTKQLRNRYFDKASKVQAPNL